MFFFTNDVWFVIRMYLCILSSARPNNRESIYIYLWWSFIFFLFIRTYIHHVFILFLNYTNIQSYEEYEENKKILKMKMIIKLCPSLLKNVSPNTVINHQKERRNEDKSDFFLYLGLVKDTVVLKFNVNPLFFYFSFSCDLSMQ